MESFLVGLDASAHSDLPFYGYFLLELPKMLTGTFGFQLLVNDPRAKLLTIVSIIYIAIISFLPHKGWQTVWYTAPLLNVVSAMFAEKA
jgi:hypothetical protein